VIFPLFVASFVAQDWSPLYPVPDGDLDAKWRYSYAIAPLTTSRPLFKEVTRVVESVYNRKGDLENLAREAMKGFMLHPNMKQLATATLIRYYYYQDTRRLDLVDDGWYENAWKIAYQRVKFGGIPAADCPANDYYLSRIRFLADSCGRHLLPVRKNGYQVYLSDTSDWRVARRLAIILEVSSAFERKIALQVVSKLEKTRSEDWGTWSVSAFVRHWSGIYSKDRQQLSLALASIDRAITDPSVPKSDLPALEREKKWILEDLRKN